MVLFIPRMRAFCQILKEQVQVFINEKIEPVEVEEEVEEAQWNEHLFQRVESWSFRCVLRTAYRTRRVYQLGKSQNEMLRPRTLVASL